MASLVLGTVGAVIGSAVGGPSGAMWGWNIGVTLGGVLFPPKMGEQQLGKLDDLRLSGSGYGAMIPQVFGNVRTGGNVIWQTDLVQHVKKKKQKSKGGGGQTIKEYSYTCSFAVAVCRGPATIKQIFAEGNMLIYDYSQSPESKFNITLYDGDESQLPDPLMESIEGVGEVPAHRGICYVVIEDLPLGDWGNRIPNLSFVVETDPFTLGDILEDLSVQCGLENTDYDYTDADDDVEGFIVGQRASVRDLIEPLLRIYATDISEFGGQLTAIKRGAATQFTLTEDDLGANSNGNLDAQDRLVSRIVMDMDLPQRLDLTYFSSDRNFQQMTQSAIRQIKNLVDEATTVNSMVVLSEDDARHTAERLLYTLWLERHTFQFSLPPAFFNLGPGNVGYLPVNGENKRVRIVGRDAGLFGELRFTATLDESDVLTQTIEGGTSPTIIPELQKVVDTSFIAWSCPLLRDMDREFPGFYVAATGIEQWRGCTVYYSKDAGVNYIEGGVITDRSLIGETAGTPIDDFDSPVEIDTSSTLSVVLTDYGELESTSQEAVDLGENAALVGDEILGFRTATPTAALEYDLTNLTRGFRNTEMNNHTVGERFVVLEETAIRIQVPWDLVGETVRIKCVSDGQSLGAVSYYQDVVICDPSELYPGGRLETWIVKNADTHLSDSDTTYTRDLAYYAEPEHLWLSVRGLMRPYSDYATLYTDFTGKAKTLEIIFPAGQEFAENDEITVFYNEYGSPINAMKTVKFTVLLAGSQTLTIPEDFLRGSVRVWLRNRMLKKSAFSIDGNDIVIDNGSLDIQPGDIIFYAYAPEININTNYFEEKVSGIDGEQTYTFTNTPVILEGTESFVADVGGIIDPDATFSGNDLTLSVDMTDSDNIPVTVRGYKAL